jgi:hypothetical protein
MLAQISGSPPFFNLFPRRLVFAVAVFLIAAHHN